jgi:hypothetical protein
VGDRSGVVACISDLGSTWVARRLH